MISRCICFNISFKEILSELDGKSLEDMDICDRCRLCNSYIEDAIKTGITDFPVDLKLSQTKLL